MHFHGKNCIPCYANKCITGKWFLLYLIACISIGFISSCNKKEAMPPTIQLDAAADYLSKDCILAPGTNFKVRILAEMGDANITNFVIKNTHGSETVSYFDTGVNNETINISKVLTKSVFDSETWTFMVIDKNGKNASVSFTVYNDTSSGYQDIRVFNDLILGAQYCQATGSFLSLNSGNIWFLNDAFTLQDSIEMLYYYDSTGDANTIASPGANIGSFIYPGSISPIYWTVRHETRFYKTAYSASDFYNVQNDSLLLVAYDEINGKRKAKNLVTGDVYAFKTAHIKYGMFVIENVAGTDSGTVQISLKIQK